MPPARPSFTRHWLVIAALLVAGLLVAWRLAGEFGYLDAGSAGPAAVGTHAGESHDG